MEFEKLLKSDKYQVFLFTCPAIMPFSFAVHPWFVVNNKGSLERFGVGRQGGARWEVLHTARNNERNWGHLHLNLLPPAQGTQIFSFTQRYSWKGNVSGLIEGGEGSLAQQMAERIESSPQTYPYCNTYSLKGPNSNTYVQWVLNQFPNSGLKLPWNAFGKSYLKP
jgi:hypothetical protein